MESNSKKMIEMIHAHDLDLAEDYFEQALLYDSDDDLLQLADELYELGFTGHLEQLLDQLIHLYPENDSLKVMLAEVYFDSNREDEAMDLIYSISEDSPSYPQALLLQADIYLVEGWVELSEEKLLQANEKTSSHPVTLFALAEFYFSQSSYVQAKSYYERLVEQDTEEFSGVDLLFRLGVCLAGLGEWEEAVDLLNLSIQRADHIDKRFQLGLCYFQLEEYDRAIEQFQEVLRLDPTYSSAYLYLARSQMKEGRYPEAKQSIDQALTYDHTHEELFGLAALIYAKLGEQEQSLEFLRKAIKINPYHSKHRLYYLHVLLDQADYEGVIEETNELEELSMMGAQSYWARAIACYELEEYDKAREAFDIAYLSLFDSEDFMLDYLQFLREEGEWDLIQNYLQSSNLDKSSHPFFLSLEQELKEREYKDD